MKKKVKKTLNLKKQVVVDLNELKGGIYLTYYTICDMTGRDCTKERCETHQCTYAQTNCDASGPRE